MAEVPIAEGLFTWPDPEPCLIGGRCRDCGCVEFPAKAHCPRCGSEHVEALALARQGRLWSWTIQGFPPKSPPYTGTARNQPFKPFGVGYIELPGQVCVEAPLTVSEPAELTIGMPMELVIRPHSIDADGNQVMAFAFAPLEGGQ